MAASSRGRALCSSFKYVCADARAPSAISKAFVAKLRGPKKKRWLKKGKRNC
jgi:hypothetical protein